MPKDYQQMTWEELEQEHARNSVEGIMSNVRREKNGDQ